MKVILEYCSLAMMFLVVLIFWFDLVFREISIFLFFKINISSYDLLYLVCIALSEVYQTGLGHV